MLVYVISFYLYFWNVSIFKYIYLLNTIKHDFHFHQSNILTPCVIIFYFSSSVLGTFHNCIKMS